MGAQAGPGVCVGRWALGGRVLGWGEFWGVTGGGWAGVCVGRREGMERWGPGGVCVGEGREGGGTLNALGLRANSKISSNLTL